MHGQRGSERFDPPQLLDELKVTLWCAAVLLAVLLAAYWFAASIYAN